MTRASSTRQTTARLATPPRTPAGRSMTKVQPVASAPDEPRRRRPSLPTISLPRPDVRGRASDLGHGVGHRVHDGLVGVRHRFEDGWDWLVTLRLPHLSPMRGSTITGLVVGVFTVAVGWGFYEIFSATLGTRAGGGWGFLAFVFLSFVAFVIGELLLAGFGVPHARVVSILSVLLVLLFVLVFFLDLAAGIWAWLLVPALTILAFVTSSAVMAAAAKEQNPQRLPWEPVDETQVKTD